MKKRLSIFLCVFAALFFGSCTDMSVSEDEVFKVDLPADFKWQEYGEINIDVKMSQIPLDIRKTKRGDDSIANCVNVLSDMNVAVAKEIYENYLQCPMEGWDKKEKCPGIYANNSNYNKQTIIPGTPPSIIVTPGIPDTTIKIDTIITVKIDTVITGTPPDTTIKLDTITTTKIDTTLLITPGKPDSTITPGTEPDTVWCAIDACWSGGWTDMENFLPDSLDKFLENSKTSLGVINAMCLFVPENSNPEATKNYLKGFDFDSTLIKRQYLLWGRYDGRPYKYCENGLKGDERSQEKHAYKRGNSYDYGRNTFCFDRNDQKIYVVVK